MEIYDKVLKFNCKYQQNGEIKSNYNWEGYIGRNTLKRESDNGLTSSLEGIVVDSQITTKRIFEIATIKKYTEDFVDERLLFCPNGLDHENGIIKFSIFPGNHIPIDYEFRYDEEDNCLYGVWYFVDKNKINTQYGGYAKLTIEQDTDMDIYNVNKKLWDWEYHAEHEKEILKMCKERISNLQQHNKLDLIGFQKAKSCFNRYEKILKMK